MTAGDPDQAHEPRHPFAPAARAVGRQFRMDPRRSIGAAARLVNLDNLAAQLGVGVRASRRLAAPPRPVPARGDTEHPAQGRDRIGGLLLLDELVPFHGIELVSRAKKAAAFTRISRSSRRIRFSRRSRRSSSRSSRGQAILALALIQIGLLEPLAQRLGRHAQIPGNLGELTHFGGHL